jgi:hypothetical protein
VNDSDGVNDLDFVLRAVDLLWLHKVRTWIFGGWGEELRGLAPQREHVDLDLLYPARDWSRVDALDLEWIDADWIAPDLINPDLINPTHLPWKRAFRLDGIMVELFRADRDELGWFTQLQRRRHDWPADVFAANGRLPVASRDALAGYRFAHDRSAAAA